MDGRLRVTPGGGPSSDLRALEALVASASAAAADGRWEAAAGQWRQAAAAGRSRKAHRSAAMCAEQEGECWRRADHAIHAEAALQQALGQLEPPSDPVATCARLAAVLGERGAGRRALAVGRQAAHMAEQTGSPSTPIARDTLVGLLQSFGRKEEQRPLVEALAASLGEDAPTVAFRRGQLLRLDGRLEEADEAFASVEERLAGVSGAEAGVAGARMERAEIGMLQGRTSGAVDAFTAARSLHEEAGRRSLGWRCEVGRVRASVRVGLPPVAPGLDEARHWAMARGLELLAVDLRTAAGLCLVGRDPESAEGHLTAAAAAAHAMGCLPRTGRIHLHLLTHIGADPSTRAGWAEAARAGLADNVPLLRELEALLTRSP